MKVSIICVGKIKEKYFTMAIDEYSKRLSKYIKLNIVEVKDEKTPDNTSLEEEEIIKKKEADRILKNFKESYIIALCIDGKQIDSLGFSDFFQQNMNSGISHITFIIGGSLGLHKSITEIADFKMSFSEMTFPHQLMRVVLLEQIYRVQRILKNEPYHK